MALGQRRAPGPPVRIGYVTDQPDAWLPAHDAGPVVQEFVRCFLGSG